MQGIGIGPALRKARLLRGKSIEEASRETRIRAEYLQALERERFETLLGDVYVRGFLRSYSSYLGLDADKVLTVYNRHFGRPKPTFPEPPPGPVRSPRPALPHLPSGVRRHPSWTFMIGVALLALGVFAAVGLLSGSKGAPASAPLPGQTPKLAASSPTVIVALTARGTVQAAVTVDGARTEYRLKEGESRTFEGNRSVVIRLDRGGAVSIIVNGHPIGAPGNLNADYEATFRPEDFRGRPSPRASGPTGAPSAGSSSSPRSSPSPSATAAP